MRRVVDAAAPERQGGLVTVRGRAGRRPGLPVDRSGGAAPSTGCRWATDCRSSRADRRWRRRGRGPGRGAAAPLPSRLPRSRTSPERCDGSGLRGAPAGSDADDGTSVIPRRAAFRGVIDRDLGPGRPRFYASAAPLLSGRPYDDRGPGTSRCPGRRSSMSTCKSSPIHEIEAAFVTVGSPSGRRQGKRYREACGLVEAQLNHPCRCVSVLSSSQFRSRCASAHRENPVGDQVMHVPPSPHFS